jgi:hypothetical protein
MNNTPKAPSDNNNTQIYHKISAFFSPSIHSFFERNHKKSRTSHRPTKRQKEEQERVSTKNYRLIQNIGIGVNIIMVGFFAFSVFYQGHFTKQALDRADSANSNTKASNINYEFYTRSDLRAYVLIIDLFPGLERPDFRGQYYPNYSIINLGKTPASNVVYIDTIVKSPDTTNFGIAYKRMVRKLDNMDNKGGVLGVGDPRYSGFLTGDTVNLNSNFVQRGTNWNHCLVVGIRYMDIFGKKHTTFGCYLMIPSKGIYVNYPYYNSIN